MQQWQIGDATITRIEELIGPLFDPARFFPDFDPEVFERHRKWLYPNQVDPSSGNLIASMHSWLIETGHHKILVDTCIGNDKDRMPYRNWHRMHTPWLQNLANAGASPDEIDFVMCTHLHIDHVGWNTRLVDGNWVPTFPNAKYVFAKTEFEFWQQARERSDTFNEVNNKTFDDSVLPIVDLAEMIEGEHELIADLVHLQPAPGHTPGSTTLQLSSKKEQAIFTGDICHHPIQVYQPDWNSAYCELHDQAIATRHSILEACADHHTLMLPAHFGPTHAGYVTTGIDGFGFAFS
ncbi:MAG TPA: MBL fold metallo-hydrolase [Gammaproteobacteria bacterium]|nr:MBL fold metallo-hydrolase [Gammaproteobacteria bacterium]